MSVKLAIKLNGAVTGYELDEAVKRSTGREYHKDIIHEGEGGVVCEIGGNSEYPYRDFKVGVGSNAATEIDLSAMHDEVYVVSCVHYGNKMGVSYNDKTIAKAMYTIRDKIQTELEREG